MSNINGFAFAMVWDKCFGANFVQAKRQPIKDHEDILVFSKNGTQPNYYPQMIKRDNPIKKGGNKQSAAIPIAITEKSILFGKGGKTYYEKYPTSQIRFSCREGRGLHPTQKPVALMEYLIKTYTNEGDLVLDNCAGSFTTAIAAENLKRNWICIEKEAKYCAIGKRRIEENRKRILALLDNIKIAEKRIKEISVEDMQKVVDANEILVKELKDVELLRQ
jgi:site-specific DNA-methyltransferase (adenine-specific)